MPVFVSLLRGVNIGGHHMIRMAALHELYVSMGFRQVRTYLQSGNVVFATGNTKAAPLGQRIESALEAAFGFRPGVILRTASEFRAVAQANPFVMGDGKDPRKLAVMFLAADPGERVREALEGMRTDPEELRVARRELYIYFPNGMGRSKLPQQLSRVLKVPATGRNWNTVANLAGMLSEIEDESI